MNALTPIIEKKENDTVEIDKIITQFEQETKKVVISPSSKNQKQVAIEPEKIEKTHKFGLTSRQYTPSKKAKKDDLDDLIQKEDPERMQNIVKTREDLQIRL